MEGHKVYLVFDKITPQLRGIFSALLIATGFLFQLSTRNILAGLPFIIACFILNLMKSIKIKKETPRELKWQEVTPQKIEQVLVQCQRVKKFQNKDIGCYIAFFIGFIVFASFVFPFLKTLSISFPMIATIINFVILFAGLIFSGRKGAWMPFALDKKTEIVKRILDLPLVKDDPNIKAIPYLEMGKGNGGTFPNDARIMLKFHNAPANFIGLQGQIAINTVKATLYPYFYVVLIAKSEFGIFEKLNKPSVPKLVIEHKRTEEVDVVVIRQRTSKTSGYHTDKNTQDYILLNGIKLAKEVIGKS